MPFRTRRSARPRAALIRKRLQAPKYRFLRRGGGMSGVGTNTYHFKRKLFLQDYLAVSTTQAAGAIQFALIDLPGYTDFTNLYDMYRFNKVVFKLIPKYTEVSLVPGSTTQNANLQQIHSVIDYDDAVSPASINQLTQYQSHKMTRGNKIHTRVLIPKCQTTVSGASAAPKSKQWLDCDQNSLAHRGIKFIVPTAGTANTTLYYDLELTYYMSFKNVL